MGTRLSSSYILSRTTIVTRVLSCACEKVR
jgi:hypothetical protein